MLQLYEEPRGGAHNEKLKRALAAFASGYGEMISCEERSGTWYASVVVGDVGFSFVSSEERTQIFSITVDGRVEGVAVGWDEAFTLH